MHSQIVTRLDKAAFDCGFDLRNGGSKEWLGFASSKCFLKVWLASDGTADNVRIALSDSVVARELACELDEKIQPPAGSTSAFTVSGFNALYRILRRAFQLSRALPEQPLRDYDIQTAGMPSATEAERLTVQRIGQDIFRAALIEYWEGRCAVTGLSVVEILRASHCKPWAQCISDAERLDVFNGFLLAPHLDALFDKGFITIGTSGDVRVSMALNPEARVKLGLVDAMKVSKLTDRHRYYLSFHAENIFRNAGRPNDSFYG